jgi:hypothetical protein
MTVVDPPGRTSSSSPPPTARSRESFAPSANDDSTRSWSITGDPVLLINAARKLRLGVEVGAYGSHPPGEYAMFGMARLLDAIAFSMCVDGAVHHTVVSGATEISRNVLDYLLPAVRSDAHPQ